jgi:hypothetical protein
MTKLAALELVLKLLSKHFYSAQLLRGMFGARQQIPQPQRSHNGTVDKCDY